MSPRARRTTALSAVALGVAALLTAGATVGLVLAPERAPSTVARTAPAGSATVDVATETFDDARRVNVTVERTAGLPLGVRDSGLVTRSACAPGAVIESGTSPVTVDDRPVLALATSVPLWRDLAPGTRGGDVTALQDELVRLGHSLRPDGVYGSATTAAVTALQRQAGVARPTGTLAATSVLWLPAARVTVGECAVGLAEPVGDGPFATTAAAPVSLSVAQDLTGLVPGDRVVRLGGTVAPVDADGRVTDAALLDALAASAGAGPTRSGEGTADKDAQVEVEYALASPLEALVVPPAALYGLAGDTGCLLGDGVPVPVRVLSSTLGTSLVVTDAAPPRRVEVAPVDPAPCR